MKKLFAVIVVLALAACKVQKTGQDTYRVVAPTPQAKKAAEKAKVQAKEVGAKLKAETEKLQQKVKTETTSTHH
jgi:uncharacterized lipoprotein YmbA